MNYPATCLFCKWYFYIGVWYVFSIGKKKGGIYLGRNHDNWQITSLLIFLNAAKLQRQHENMRWFFKWWKFGFIPEYIRGGQKYTSNVMYA